MLARFATLLLLVKQAFKLMESYQLIMIITLWNILCFKVSCSFLSDVFVCSFCPFIVGNVGIYLKNAFLKYYICY